MTDEIVTVRCRAMATIFEIALWGKERLYLETVGEQAVEEINRLEQQLSLYREDSDIFELNVRAAYYALPVDPRLFRLLQRAQEIHQETGGAFDITVAPLVRAWGFMGASGSPADAEAVEAARDVVGMDLIELDAANYTVHFRREGVMIDLGAIGKGYAIEQVGEMLRDYEVGGGLVHGGTSTVVAVGGQPDGSPWSVAIQDPTDPENHLTVIPLRDRALSVSALHGKYFTDGDTRYGHVLDPRTGQPVQNALLAAITCESATDSDALSTALLVQGETLLPILGARPETGALVAARGTDGTLVVTTQNLLAAESGP